jgi:hypothetical protein
MDDALLNIDHASISKAAGIFVECFLHCVTNAGTLPRQVLLKSYHAWLEVEIGLDRDSIPLPLAERVVHETYQ